MRHYRVAGSVSLALTMLLAGAATTSIASASSGIPHAGTPPVWSFVSARVTAGKPIPLTFKVARLPGGEFLQLARTFGTSKVWRAVLTLHPTGGQQTADAPGVVMGAYDYKMLIVRGGKTVATSTVHPLWSYGNVSMLTICNIGGWHCGSGNVQIMSNIFDYQMWQDPSANSSPGETAINFPKTSCRSATLAIAALYEYNPMPGNSATLQIIQTRSDPITTTIQDNTIARLSAGLDGGPFYINEWVVDNSDNYNEYIYFAGQFSCYTPNGKR